VAKVKAGAWQVWPNSDHAGYFCADDGALALRSNSAEVRFEPEVILQ